MYKAKAKVTYDSSDSSSDDDHSEHSDSGDIDIDDLLDTLNKMSLTGDEKRPTDDRRRRDRDRDRNQVKNVYKEWNSHSATSVFHYKSSFVNSPIALKSDDEKVVKEFAKKDFLSEFESNEYTVPKLPAHLNTLKTKYGLSDKEILVVYIYTLEQGGYFKAVNTALRKYKHKAYEQFIYHLNCALKQIRKYDREHGDNEYDSKTLYRGMNGVWGSKNQEQVVMKTFTSSSEDEQVAKAFAKKGGLVMEICDWKSAGNIGPFSRFPTEAEYLFPPYTVFTVEEYDSLNNIVILKEK